jgi:hypothetical protein
VNAEAREALAQIQQCIASDRYMTLTHFMRRMDERGLCWPDIQAVIDDPTDVRDGGLDDFDRPKWLVSGEAADGLRIEIVCVLDVDERGVLTVLITIYFEE